MNRKKFSSTPSPSNDASAFATSPQGEAFEVCSFLLNKSRFG